MKNVAFTLIGGYKWLGGYNYQLNLIKALVKYESEKIIPYLFLGQDVDKEILSTFTKIDGLHIIQSDVFDKKAEVGRLLRAIILGSDRKAFNIFSLYKIDVVFEVANFYGWRFPIATIAWIPDLQHRMMRHLFGFFSYWKREIGFQFQINSHRRIMLSSEDAKSTLERLYPKAIGKTSVVRFAVPTQAFNGDFDELKQTYHLPEHFFFLPSQFWQHKNHECVIRALAIAKEQGHEITVIATGRESDTRNPLHFEELQTLIRTLKVEDNFRSLGPIPYKHILGLMQLCEGLINPSFFEGWSTTVEEAKALGIRMLLSDLTVHQEQAAQYAEFFDPKSPDALAGMLINFNVIYQSARPTLTQAKSASNKRVDEFASTFTDVVTLSSSSSC